jgi:hypothetical protein
MLKDEIHLLRRKLLIEVMRFCEGGIIIQNYRLPKFILFRKNRCAYLTTIH